MQTKFERIFSVYRIPIIIVISGFVILFGIYSILNNYFFNGNSVKSIFLTSIIFASILNLVLIIKNFYLFNKAINLAKQNSTKTILIYVFADRLIIYFTLLFYLLIVNPFTPLYYFSNIIIVQEPFSVSFILLLVILFSSTLEIIGTKFINKRWGDNITTSFVNYKITGS